MEIRPSEHSADVLVLLPEGRLDAQAAPGLEDAFATLRGEGRGQIVLDFSESRYISSSCLRVMLVHVRKLREAGGDLKLCCLSDRIAKVFDIAGLDAVFDIFAAEEQAVQAFLAPSPSADS